MVRVRVPSFAKLNLDLRILHKRPDDYHELRTIFQTISLHDTLTIECRRAKKTEIFLESAVDIKDNLVLRAAQMILAHLKSKIWVRFVLDKKIPLGAGLGGGSSNAAAVLIALPALIGKKIHIRDLVRFAEELGSDVPFFLHGGTALGLGRGTELYPLPDLRSNAALVVASGVHVSTAAAYRALERAGPASLTSPAKSPILGEFQTIAWTLGNTGLDQLPLKNDFEKAVFGMHPELAATARKLRRIGAKPALMTGSGSAVFGVFQEPAQAKSAASHFGAGSAVPVHFISRVQYRQAWRRALGSAADLSCLAL